ncbi:hypothetical protein [Chitinophaga pinensis]|uniref:Uncharacterized protein n=1 Tax=Chitinophaga pinensis (strain ATCC 43595 / DSM 2588 / LMG 13176 / NBRC 15968 / NCIMB 11800 / UQM 2034) TaxID=485918 RepID=A0A979GZD7_CHIPD|nr:hypothetical protein [Chitinophaga pinensis]ACU63861.1 hypothetical protein Cpin_6457 [Chitinophaga pinensis DSM 2588]
MKLATSKRKNDYTFPKPQFTIDNNMRDYSDDPFFKKKFEQAKASLEKCPIPDRLVTLAKRNLAIAKSRAALCESGNVINPG